MTWYVAISTKQYQCAKWSYSSEILDKTKLFLTAVSFKGDKRYVERRGVKHISEIGCICNLQRIKAANGCVQFSVGFSYSLVIISAKYNIKLRFGLTGLEIGSGLGLGFGLGIGIRLNLYWT